MFQVGIFTKHASERCRTRAFRHAVQECKTPAGQNEPLPIIAFLRLYWYFVLFTTGDSGAPRRGIACCMISRAFEIPKNAPSKTRHNSLAGQRNDGAG